jgi:hypothetical protein
MLPTFFQAFTIYQILQPVAALTVGEQLTFVKIDCYWHRDLGYDACWVRFVEKDVTIYELTEHGIELQEEYAHPERFFQQIGTADPTSATEQFQQRTAQEAIEKATRERQRALADAQCRLEKHRRRHLKN